jgi:TPP-dependent pyruvate/acetoin dehydrogenase alpha subunit
MSQLTASGALVMVVGVSCGDEELEVGLSLHSRVSDWLHGSYRLSSTVF